MNAVALIGRLTKDPEVRYTQEGKAIAQMTVAIDRPPRKDGTKETDFPRITVFGKQAENCEKYLKKGRLVGINGRIQTGSYTNKNGEKVYTTDVVAEKVEFLEWVEKTAQTQNYGAQTAPQGQYYSGGYGQPNQQYQQYAQASSAPNPNVSAYNQQQMPAGWEAIQDDNVPF